MDNYIYTNPNQLKLKKLFQSTHEKQVTDLAMFIKKDFYFEKFIMLLLIQFNKLCINLNQILIQYG